ncbi:uncharacterized protein [Solanum lycopersicum]|uniref:uncharacterized protein n=1 Tax=Solanum lycopersicum TaxID=4081 RepID=UPI003747C2E4
MTRTRANVTGGRGEALLEVVVEAPSRVRGRAQARGRARGTILARGRVRGAAPVRGRSREVFTKPQIDDREDQLRGPAREWWMTYLGAFPVGYPPMTWEKFSSAFHDRFIPWSVTRESHLRFENLTRDGLPVTEYDACFSQFFRHALTIISDETKRIHKFMRRLTFSIRSAVFRTSRKGAFFQSIVRDAKEAELMEREELGTLKRPVHQVNFMVPHLELGDHKEGMTVTLAMLGVSRVEWKGVNGSYPKMVIFFIRAWRLVERGCLSYVDFIRDTSVEPSPMNSVPVVQEFPDVFPSDLLSAPPDRNIDFSIDLEPITKTISIPPYRMAPTELKELKDQLQDLLSKGFIRPSVSPKGAPVASLFSKIDLRFGYHQLKIRASSYYRRFVQSLSTIAAPLTRLTRQDLGFSVIRAHQFDDEKLCLIRDKVLREKTKEVVLDFDGVLRIEGRICVPKMGDLIRLILEEAHCSRYSIHPGKARMYHDLSHHYLWYGMKMDISDFVSRCLTCQQVKCEHQRLGGVSQKMHIPTWKWEWITMDFVVGLPTTVGGYDSIWVVVDRLNKSAHFIPVRVKYTAKS